MENFELNDDIAVMYVQAKSFPIGIQAAFQQLESKLSSIDKRTFYGISWAGENGKIIYKAAASQLHDEEATQTGLDTFIIGKGTYMSVLIKDFMNAIPKIGETFNQLLRHPELDTNSYCLELYKGPDVLCLVKLDTHPQSK